MAREAALEALLVRGSAKPDAIHALVAEIAGLRGELRYQHLAAHLAMRDILTADQVALYDRPRGYTADGNDAHQEGHQHGPPQAPARAGDTATPDRF